MAVPQPSDRVRLGEKTAASESASMPFDPYQHWLGIAPTGAPPNYYELLGFAPFSGTPAEFVAAAQRRIHHVASFQHQHPELVQRVVGELFAARQCLVDAASRAAYDAQLQAPPSRPQPLAPAARPRPIAVAPSAAADSRFEDLGAPSFAMAGPSNPGAKRSSRKVGFHINWIGHVVASVGGLCVGYYILVSIGPQYDFLHLWPRPPQAAIETGERQPSDAATGDSSARASSRGSEFPESADSPPPAIDWSAANESTLNAGEEETRGDASPPVVAVRPRTPLEDLAAQVDLPPLLETGDYSLGAVHLPAEQSIELQLISAPLSEAGGQRLKIEPQGERQWIVRLDAAPPMGVSTLSGAASGAALAQLRLVDEQLMFRWNPEAAKLPWRQLRNCLVNVKAGGEEKLVQLRRVVKVPPLRVDLDQRTQSVALAIEDAPLGAEIHLKLTEMKPLAESYAVDPTERDVVLGKPLTVSFSRVPGARLQLDTNLKDGVPTLTLAAVYRLTGSAEFDFTTDRVNKQKETFERLLAEGKAELPRRQQYIRQLEDNYRRVSNIRIPSGPGSAIVALQKSQQLGKIESEMGSNVRKIKSLIKKIPEWQNDLAALETVANLGNELHEKTRIRFRVDALIPHGDLEVRLALVESDDALLGTSPNPLPAENENLAGSTVDEIEPMLGEKQPTPDEAAAAEAARQVGGVYREQYTAAKTIDERRQLAQRLAADALRLQSQPTTQFVMLRIAKEIAAQAGDIAAVERFLGEMDQRFEIDLEAQWAPALAQLAQTRLTPDEARRAAELALPRVKRALARDQFELAQQLLDTSQDLAQRSGDAELRKTIASLVAQGQTLAEERKAVEQARETLAADPNHAAANREVGQYECFLRDDWEQGLPRLARGDDAGLAALAERELASPSFADEQVTLGDAWWDWAATASHSFVAPARQRAAHWYRLALPNATGLVRLKLQKRLEDVGSER